MSQEICRVCLEKGNMIDIFEEHNSVKISSTLMNLTGVEICEKDKLPKTICTKCVEILDQCTKFILLCNSSDNKLRKCEVSNEELTQHHPFLNANKKSSVSTESSNEIKSIEESSKHCQVKKRKQRTKAICDICGKVLSCRSALKLHRATHSDERLFSCSKCEKTYKSKSSLTDHMLIHTSKNIYTCEVCGIQFKYKQGLRVHRRRHAKEPGFRCLTCYRGFYTKYHLQYHLRIHTDERNYECDTCGKSFKSKFHLVDHMRSHSKEKQFVCSMCGLRFVRPHYVQRHIKHKHISQKQGNDSSP